MRSKRASDFFSLNALNDLNSPSARRRFFWVFLLISFLTGTLYFSISFFFPENLFVEFTRAVSANIFSAALTVLVIYGAYVHFIHEDIERPEIETLRPTDISDEIKRLPNNTAFYFLWARSATYFRAETLRSLSSHAQKNRKTIDLTILLPDPEIEDLSVAYEDMVKTLGERNGKDKLFVNAVATSAACALFAANNRNLKIKVCLSKFLPSFRMDMSDGGAILTEDDKSLYGLKFSRRSQFFEMFRTMMIYEVELSRQADLKAFNWRDHSLEGHTLPVEALLSLGFTEARVRQHKDEILSKIHNKDHRYK